MGLELLAVHGQGHGSALDRLTQGQADLGVAVLAVFGARGLLIAIAAGIAVRRLAVAAIRLAALTCSTAEHREDVVDVVGAAARSGEADARAIAAGTGLDAVTVCEVFSGGVGIDQANANEALIESAPELYAAAAEVQE